MKRVISVFVLVVVATSLAPLTAVLFSEQSASSEVMTLQVPPPPEHTPGVEFTLEEVSRTANNGLTEVDYQPVLSGLPQGNTYELANPTNCNYARTTRLFAHS